MTIDLGDFKTNAELTYPRQQKGPFPTVILVHGTGPEDMDATAPNAAPFRQLAHALSQQGFAVLRYNKHFVEGPGKVDWARFSGTSPRLFAADLEKVLLAARQLPQVDGRAVYLYGWSEGSAVAAQVAAFHPELAGLVVQGPVSLSWTETVKSWLAEAVDYLRKQNPGGQVTAEDLVKAAQPPAGFAVSLSLGFFFDLAASRSGRVAVNPWLDRNHDGRLDLKSEVEPALDQVVANLLSENGAISIYGSKKSVPTVTEQAPRLKLPVLVLQGENDGSTVAAGLPALERALHAAGVPHEVHRYPGLGHGLDPVPSPLEDTLGPIAPQPIADLVHWLKGRQPRR